MIDACDAFAHGQVYVALSRCRTLDGLVLSSRINRRSFIDNPVISGFVNGPLQIRPDSNQLAESKKAYQQQLLSELFDFTSLVNKLNYCLKTISENQVSILGNPGERLEKILSLIRTDLVDVSDKFQPHLKILQKVDLDPESNMPLQERLKKAAVYFSDKLEADMKDILNGFSVETDNRTIRKSVTEALERTRKECVTKLACLNAVRTGFETRKYLDARAKSAIEIPPARSHTSSSMEDTSGIVKHPSLLRRLKEWRNNKARETTLPHYMILPQKTIVTLANLVPQTSRALRQVKGMGTKKAEKYGEELLDIIVSYCTEEKIEAPEITIPEKKREKKVKEETKKISHDLFREGKTIQQIAEERSLSLTTIEGHLAYYVGRGEIPVTEFVSQGNIDLIAGHFEGSDDLRIGPVKEALGDRVSWSDIRFVVNHLTFLRKNLRI